MSRKIFLTTNYFSVMLDGKGRVDGSGRVVLLLPVLCSQYDWLTDFSVLRKRQKSVLFQVLAGIFGFFISFVSFAGDRGNPMASRNECLFHMGGNRKKEAELFQDSLKTPIDSLC